MTYRSHDGISLCGFFFAFRCVVRRTGFATAFFLTGSGISLEPGQNSSGQMGINIYGMNSEANGDEMCITIKNGTEPYAVLLIETRYSD